METAILIVLIVFGLPLVGFIAGIMLTLEEVLKELIKLRADFNVAYTDHMTAQFARMTNKQFKEYQELIASVEEDSPETTEDSEISEENK